MVILAFDKSSVYARWLKIYCSQWVWRCSIKYAFEGAFDWNRVFIFAQQKLSLAWMVEVNFGIKITHSDHEIVTSITWKWLFSIENRLFQWRTRWNEPLDTSIRMNIVKNVFSIYEAIKKKFLALPDACLFFK